MDKTVNPFELCKHDEFSYGGERYVALGDPSGEFSTTIKVRRLRDNVETEVYIRDGNKVTIHDPK